MGATPPRRALILALLTAFIIILTTAHYLTSPHSSSATETLGKIAASVDDKVDDLLHPGDKTEETSQPSAPPANPAYEVPGVTAESEKGNDEVGKHFHVRPSAATTKEQGLQGCKYPIVIHVTPDLHCTGAFALYGSIVRNVLLQPEALQNKTCVHFTYVDPTLKTIEAMYKWPARPNPFTNVKDCAALDTTPALNNIVPVRFQALVPIEKPAIMEAGLQTWLAALNKVYSWAFDLYPRILILDADSIVITDLHRIFLDSPLEYTISGAPDQFWNCGDRSRLNGGMILLKPSRYFHITVSELLYDKNGSCVSGKWEQSEQELLNCVCGTNGPVRGSRSEFHCEIMPLFNSVWPKNYGCSAANVVPIRSIHFTAATKPWLVKEGRHDERFDYGFWRCVRDATRAGELEGLKKCQVPELEVTRLVTGGLPPGDK